MSKTLSKSGLATASLLLTTSIAFAQAPDVTVSRVGGGPSSSDFNEFGPIGGIYAYSMGTTSCNIGNATADWFWNGASGSETRHPVIAQNAYRLLDGRFEQIGLAWLKHGFCAVSENTCGSCQATDCNTLGIGCADTYGAGLNDGPGLGPRNPVNAAAGTHPHPINGNPGSNAIEGRLQIHATDIGNPGALYFFEAHYVTADDHQAGNGLNNASYRQVNMNNPLSVTSIGGTVTQMRALSAWQANDPNVEIRKALVIDEGGPNAHGAYYVGFLVTDNGNGTWTYEYAVYNMTSDRSCGSFRVPIAPGTNLSNIGFHDVDYHGVGAYDGTDWTPTVAADSITWSTDSFGTNPNANALRWATLYNFRFTADGPPGNVTAEIGLFKPGTPTSITTFVDGPSGPVEPGAAFCYGDGTGAACPCGNDGASGEGCATTTGSGMTISGSGSTSISADDLTMTAEGVPLSNSGIFYAGTVAGPGASLFDGIQCAIGSTLRFQGQVSTTSTVSDTGFVAQDLFGLFWTPGQTYNFQYYSRDNQAGPSPCGGFANLSPAYAVTMTP